MSANECKCHEKDKNKEVKIKFSDLSEEEKSKLFATMEKWKPYAENKTLKFFFGNFDVSIPLRKLKNLIEDGTMDITREFEPTCTETK